MFNSKQFANDLFMLRTKRGISRALAAKEIGIHSSTMQTLESNIHEPRISVYWKVCKWMDSEPSKYFKL